MARKIFGVILITFMFPVDVSAGYYTIDPKSGDSASRQFENLYQAAVAAGTVPVMEVTIKNGDRIVDILREQDAFFGRYVPFYIQSLVCDLNPGCPRRRKLRESESVPPVTGEGWPSNRIKVLHSILELEESEIDTRAWPQPNQTILIPKFQVAKIRSSNIYNKARGTPLAQIALENEVCVSEKISLDDCMSSIVYMNGFNTDIAETSYSGSIQVPAYSYNINTDCVTSCAVSHRDIYFDTEHERFVKPAFYVVNIQSSEESNIEVFDKRYKNYQFDNLRLPDEVKRRLKDYSGELQKLEWKAFPPNGLKVDSDYSVSDLKDFNHNGRLLDLILYPRKLDDLVSRKVMVVDANFDKGHCEFSSGTVEVYDCRKFDGTAVSQCTLVESSDSATPPKRELCGDIGIMKLEGVTAPQEKQVLERHGTQMVGLIAANWDDYGIGGLSPETHVVGVQIDFTRLFSNLAYGSYLLAQISNLIQDKEISTVILASEQTSNNATRNWFYELVASNSFATFVVSGGNMGSKDVNCETFPACFSATLDNLIAVAALKGDNSGFTETSTVHLPYAVAAIGESVATTTPLNKCDLFSGSSPATAIVGAVVNVALRSIKATGAWQPGEIKNRLIVCSNVSSKMSELMRGGALDASCVINAGSDLIYKNGVADPILAKRLSTSLPDSTQEKLLFEDEGSADREFSFARVRGFQRMPDDPTRFVLFYAKSTSADASVEKRVGAFPGELINQRVKIKRFGGETEIVPISDIQKYVRAKE